MTSAHRPDRRKSTFLILDLLTVFTPEGIERATEAFYFDRQKQPVNPNLSNEQNIARE